MNLITNLFNWEGGFVNWIYLMGGILFVLICVIYLFNKKLKKVEKLKTGFPIIIMFLAFCLFPDDYLIITIIFVWLIILISKKLFKGKKFLTENMKASIVGGYIAGFILVIFQLSLSEFNSDQRLENIAILLTGFMMILLMIYGYPIIFEKIKPKKKKIEKSKAKKKSKKNIS